MNPYASSEDLEVCRQLHRRHGTTYYFATSRFPKAVRRKVHAVYGFVRVPDEWVDNPRGTSVEDRVIQLEEWRGQLLRGIDGIRPNHPVMRAFCDVVLETKMPLEEPMRFLDAMEMDLTVTRYPTYADLEEYMRGSAAAVGMMMCSVLGLEMSPARAQAAQALGNAMQLTNCLRDIGEDTQRGRLYLPLEDLEQFAVSPDEIFEARISPRFVQLMRFEIDRARALYSAADAEIALLPRFARKPVALARELYARILDRIEERNYDVFGGRARTSSVEKLAVAARVILLK